ncbi:AsnC family transcriptional regulator [Micromonospora sp. NBC_01796]|uniref:AsnC family transcriptional regulator n=1 Tax=Micromonospora sp. NBC_01796 TaxID=2975987 RepID=UPI003FA35FAD
MAAPRRHSTGLDDLDRQIVVALQADGRASWTRIARTCGTSVPTIAHRGQQLLREGLVRERGPRARHNPA